MFVKSKIVLLVLLTSIVANAQGDGPRNLMWGPKGVTALIPKWMSLDQNITPGNVLVKDADIQIDVFPITLIHNFNIGGHFAQVMLNAVPGSASGSLEADQPSLPAPHLSTTGFSDGFVGFKYGIINTPTLDVVEFAKHKQVFSMFLYTRLWYSGSYDKTKALNLGTNRISFDFGPVANVHFGNNPKRPTILESYAALHLYGANNSPSIGTSITPPFYANETKQKPSFSWENHFSHNFTDKFWGDATLRYQYGGALEVDGVNQDNKMNILGWGVNAGYQALPMLSFQAGYGSVLIGDNDARSNMFRIAAVISYVNMKKVKEENKQ